MIAHVLIPSGYRIGNTYLHPFTYLNRHTLPGRGPRGDRSPANLSAFNIMPMGVVWKESTSNGHRPPPPIVAPWHRPCTLPQLSTLSSILFAPVSPHITAILFASIRVIFYEAHFHIQLRFIHRVATRLTSRFRGTVKHFDTLFECSSRHPVSRLLLSVDVSSFNRHNAVSLFSRFNSFGK